LSSSAIVLQCLSEKGLRNTAVGQSSFAVVLFQDIAVIPILVFLPILATSIPAATNDIHPSLISSYSGWLQALIIIGTITLIYFGGRFLFVLLFKIVAKTRLQELFTASALLLVVSISCLMDLIGISPALGTFLSGVVLANSEFRHELHGDIAPFKGLLLGLFFIGVGASINFKLVLDNPIFILVFGAILTFVKFTVSFLISRFYKNNTEENILFGLGLSQSGEFGFVIMSFCIQLEIVPIMLASQIMAIIAMSMVSTPFLQFLFERFILPNSKIIKKEIEEDETSVINEHNPVVIAGFGHFGSTVGRLLRANNIKSTILDNDCNQIDFLKKMGFKAHYGDATRLELLEAAGCANAKLFIAAIDDPKTNLSIIETLRVHFPNLKILTRARNRIEAYELIDHKVDHIYRETLYSAVNMGIDVLVELGFRKYTATRQANQFIKNDELTTWKLAKKRYNKTAYLTTINAEIIWLKKLLKNDLKSQQDANNHSWDGEHLKKKMAE
ncbi:MAG TPA: cation:proton antiporter, partial [Flavobacterium sp.]|nr:cation:proton antiporter [Flavobacterium sp.]